MNNRFNNRTCFNNYNNNPNHPNYNHIANNFYYNNNSGINNDNNNDNCINYNNDDNNNDNINNFNYNNNTRANNDVANFANNRYNNNFNNNGLFITDNNNNYNNDDDNEEEEEEIIFRYNNNQQNRAVEGGLRPNCFNHTFNDNNNNYTEEEENDDNNNVDNSNYSYGGSEALIENINIELAMLSLPNQLISFLTDNGLQFFAALGSYLIINNNDNFEKLCCFDQKDILSGIINNFTSANIDYDDLLLRTILANNQFLTTKLNKFFCNNTIFTIEDEEINKFNLNFDISGISLLLIIAVLIPTNEQWFGIVKSFADLLESLDNEPLTEGEIIGDHIRNELLHCSLLTIRATENNEEIDNFCLINIKLADLFDSAFKYTNNEEEDDDYTKDENKLFDNYSLLILLITRYRLIKLNRKRITDNSFNEMTKNCNNGESFAIVDNFKEVEVDDLYSDYEQSVSTLNNGNIEEFFQEVNMFVNSSIESCNNDIDSDKILDEQFLESSPNNELFIRANVITRLVYFGSVITGDIKAYDNDSFI